MPRAVRSRRHQFSTRHTFQYGASHNSGLFSSHWLENRLHLESEWDATKEDATSALQALANLWRLQKGRVELYEDEQGLEEAFIQPVLETLGWKLKYQTFLQPRKPDYALFLDDASLDAALQAGRRSPDFWKHPVVVADAKAWQVRLDRPAVVNGKREYPPEQIEWYLNRSHLGYGILTNGRLWRLVPRLYELHQRRFETYLQVELPVIIEGWEAAKDSFIEAEWWLEEFLPFYLFFGPTAFREEGGRKSLLRRAAEGSSEYRLGVGEDLRTRAFEALRLCISGLLHYRPNGLDPTRDLELCREQSFVLLYRLLFIMFAEDRGLLPYRTNPLYTDNRSLARHRDEIAGRLDRISETRESDYSKESTAIWEDLQTLFDLIDGGRASYGVPAYNGGLFDGEQHPFLTKNRIADRYLARVIDYLGRAKDPDMPAIGLSRVDYRDLAIQHLGGVYEGLLELHPRYASEPMIVIRATSGDRSVERTIPASERIPARFERGEVCYEQGAVYLETNKGERRATGSYYTPDHIVTHIVNETLGPLCKAISQRLAAEIAEASAQCDAATGEEQGRLRERCEALQADFDDRVLQLRILDPAMGSGHFLLRACQYLAEEITTHPYTADKAVEGAADDESSVAFWKRRVVERCLYGVDLNPLAVELAKLALWLETVSVGRPLTFLDHHICTGNSLIGARVARMGVMPGELALLENKLGKQLEEKLPVLLEPLRAIQGALSESLADVKEKDRLYRTFEKVREPFRDLADLWCSAFVTDELEAVTTVQYQQALDCLAQPRKFAKLSKEDWFIAGKRRTSRPDVRPFHWELEFPEVFFGDTGRRTDAGFDAIIGNPPYDVLSERESGLDLSVLRAVVDDEEMYAPSRRGKNNLYKLFICRSLHLLAPGGYFSFITPMAVLGDDQAANVRRRIMEIGSFTGIEAFPQKDNPRRRVFPEAKLSTAVFSLRKGPADGRFRSRVHSANAIEEESPSLFLTTAEIPLYDPSNLSIVSCSQADWDLATRIMQTGRLERLGDRIEFFQGEVNETNERQRGNLAEGPRHGLLVTRGAGICLYVVRPESQGKDLYVNVHTFLNGKAEGSKAFHHRQRRVALQESSPQNNFRRIIAALVPAGKFFNHTVNYCTERSCSLDLRFILALLNSKLADWYFRLGSTNAHVSHYQLYNLPCPVFGVSEEGGNAGLKRAFEALAKGDADKALAIVAPALAQPPFPREAHDALVASVDRIIAIEESRKNMVRNDRSALAPEAQLYQDFIDRVLYAMAGLTDEEAAGLEERLEKML